MAGYQVMIAAVRKAGRAASSAGEQAATVDLAGAVSGVPGALPGSRSAKAVTGMANAWRARITAWSADAKELGQDMSSSADRYVLDDEAAERDFSTILIGGIGLF